MTMVSSDNIDFRFYYQIFIHFSNYSRIVRNETEKKRDMVILVIYEFLLH